jgi:hypothetical protein
MLYEIPGLGSLEISRDGEDRAGMGFGLRYKWRFVATDTDGNTFRSWGTTPADADANTVFGLACDAISAEVEKFTGDDTGNMWSVYASDVESGDEHAANYAVGVLFYRTESYAYNPDGDTYRTKSSVRESIMSAYNGGWISEGHTTFVYRNNDDEPVGCYTVGPRGGLKWENY